MDLFEHAEAKAARNDALHRVIEHGEGWNLFARDAVWAFPLGWQGTGEDIRVQLMELGMPPPHHHNAWGALINTCVRQGLLEWTGELAQMRSLASHARSTKVYRRSGVM